MESAAFLPMESHLDRIDPIEFCSAPHRKVPDSLRKKLTLRHYRVPLATGVGQAVFATSSENEESLSGEASSAAGASEGGVALRPLIVLLHGLGDDCVYPYWHWMEIFTKQGLDVLSIEWDGHGNEKSSALDFQTATRSIPIVLQRLFSEPGRGMLSQLRQVPPLYLVGHSTGASLALIAATRPDVARLIKAVVAVSPVLGKIGSSSYRSYERMGYFNPLTWMRDFGSRLSVYGFRGLQTFSGHASEQLPIKLRIGLPVEEQASAFFTETFAERRVLRSVQCPVVWIHGAKDRYSPYSAAIALMEEIPTPLQRHLEPKRTHLSLAFSNIAPKYIAQFVQAQGTSP